MFVNLTSMINSQFVINIFVYGQFSDWITKIVADKKEEQWKGYSHKTKKKFGFLFMHCATSRYICPFNGVTYSSIWYTFMYMRWKTR